MLIFFKKYNSRLILLGLAAALFFGILTPQIFETIYVIGEIFIKLLKLFALPLVCSSLIVTLGNLGNSFLQLKSLVRGVIGYILLSELMAVSIALMLFNVFRVGEGIDPHLLPGLSPGSGNIVPNLMDAENSFTFSQFLLSVIPNNIFEALVKYDLLPVVVFSILFGIGCNFLGNGAKPVVTLASSIRDISMACLNGVMWVSPFGIFVLVGSGISQAHLRGNLLTSLMALLHFIVVLFAGLILHALWQLSLVVFLTRQRPRSILQKSIPVLTTAFGTSSSLATLPVAMKVADQLKAIPSVTQFMLPLCASINMGGMMMYEVAAALFFSQMLGYSLSLPEQLMLAVLSIFGGIAVGGIPETSMVSMVIVFKMVHVPVSAISLLLPLDRIIDRFRTMVNIFGNMCGVIVVSEVSQIWGKAKVKK